MKGQMEGSNGGVKWEFYIDEISYSTGEEKCLISCICTFTSGLRWPRLVTTYGLNQTPNYLGTNSWFRAKITLRFELYIEDFLKVRASHIRRMTG